MFFFFKHKKAYELRIRDWSSDVCSSDLGGWATINGSDYAKVLGGGIIAFDATDYTDKDDASSWLDGEIISDSENAPDTPFFGSVGGDVQLGGLRYTAARSEEHTSELQSLMRISYAVLCLKKKKKNKTKK